MKIVRVLSALLLLGLLAAGVAGYLVWSEAQAFLEATPSQEREEKVLSIPRGSGPGAVSRLLADNGIVTDAEKFKLFLRVREAAGKLRAGEFRFTTDLTPDEVLDLLINAPEVTYPITLPPGLRIEEMAALVEEAGMGSAAEYTKMARSKDFIAAANLPFANAPENLEGLLVPETYNLGPGADAKAVVEAQLSRLRAIWTPERRALAKQRGLTPYEVMIMASLVEKETGVAEERPLIAGVFFNRMRIGMKLQTDPTIIYGLPNYDGNIRKRDITHPHRWNTYVIDGLPPTPIAGGGLEAVEGVLHPTETKALYFVAKGGGAHYFSKSLAEHNRAVRKYILKR
ncbi:MAG: endolytic transglycosylase MltG [Deltaproteobacteria bacterium]|nr:endolytic transglycosylase MltG [Deltaproteobacteria bacterium]